MYYDQDRRTTYLQMLTHFLGDGTQTDGGEVVDGEARVLGVVHGEHPAARHPDLGILESLRDSLQAHALRDLGEQDLDEDTRTGRSVVLRELDAVEHIPRDSVGGQ